MNLDSELILARDTFSLQFFDKYLSNFNILNTIFEYFFKISLPARSTIEVSKLPKEARVEIEAIGYINV